MEANGKCGHRPPPKTSVRKKSLPPKINYGNTLFTSWDDDDAAKYEGDRWPWCKTSLSPPPLSLAWEALIPSACNRHPSPFSRGSGAYGRTGEGRIGSHGEGEGSLNLKDTHARWMIRIATKITRTILDDVEIYLLLPSNPIWLIRWQSFENPSNCYKCFEKLKIGPCHLNLLYHILYFWLQLSHNLVTLGLKDIPTWKLNNNYPK